MYYNTTARVMWILPPSPPFCEVCDRLRYSPPRTAADDTSLRKAQAKYRYGTGPTAEQFPFRTTQCHQAGLLGIRNTACSVSNLRQHATAGMESEVNSVKRILRCRRGECKSSRDRSATPGVASNGGTSRF